LNLNAFGWRAFNADPRRAAGQHARKTPIWGRCLAEAGIVILFGRLQWLGGVAYCAISGLSCPAFASYIAAWLITPFGWLHRALEPLVLLVAARG